MLPNSLIKLLVLPLRNTQNSLNDIIKPIKRYNFPRLRLNQWSIGMNWWCMRTLVLSSEIIQNMPVVGGLKERTKIKQEDVLCSEIKNFRIITS